MINAFSKRFRPIVNELLANCQKMDIFMMPFDGLRSPQKQAEYWVQGRTQPEIENAIIQLKKKDAYFLASCLEAAERRQGVIITNALPGCSWHQWGEAIDCYWFYENSKIWDLKTKNRQGRNGYQVYAEEARKLRLHSGYYWQTFIDAGHVQLRNKASPLDVYSFNEVNEVMEDFYG